MILLMCLASANQTQQAGERLVMVTLYTMNTMVNIYGSCVPGCSLTLTSCKTAKTSDIMLPV